MVWFYVATAVDWTALQGTRSISLFELYSSHCNLLPLWTIPTTHLSLQEDDSNKEIELIEKVSCLLSVASSYKQLNTGTEKKEEREPHRAERGTASLQHCPCYLRQAHNIKFRSTCLYKFFWASPKKYYFTSHHRKIQFTQKTCKLLSSWLTKTEEKSARQAEHQAWQNLETITSNHFHTPMSKLKLMLAKSQTQQSCQVIWTPGS